MYLNATYGDYINWANYKIGQLTIQYDNLLNSGEANISGFDTKIDDIIKWRDAIQYEIDLNLAYNQNIQLFINRLVEVIGNPESLIINYSGTGYNAYNLYSQLTVASSTGGGGSIAWGSITGTLSAQTDLQTALNAKEDLITAGTTTQYYRGDKTFQTLDTSVVPENGNLYFTTARVLATVLTGYVTGANTAINNTDTVLSAFGKTQGQINALTTAGGLYLLKSNNLSDVASASTSRTNLGLGTIATQDASAVAITGGSINSTAIGNSTPSTGAFTTLTASTSFFLTTTGTTANRVVGFTSGLVANATNPSTGSVTLNTGRLNAGTFTDPYQTNLSYNGSNIPTNFAQLENGATIFGAYGQMPVRGANGTAMATMYPGVYTTTTCQFRELQRLHISPTGSQNFVGVGTGLTTDYTFQLNTIDFFSTNWQSYVSSRIFSTSTGGMMDYYNYNYSYNTISRIMRIGADPNFLFSIAQMKGATSVALSTSNFIAFSDASVDYIMVHSILANSATTAFGVLNVRAYVNLTATSIVAIAGSKLQKWYAGNGSGSFTNQATMEANGSLRLLGGLEVGNISANYMGGSATDICKLYVRGVLNDYVQVAESGTYTAFLVGDKPNFAVQQARTTTTTTGAVLLYAIAVPTDTTMRITAYITARRTAGSDPAGYSSSYITTCVYKNTAGTITVVGGGVPTQLDTREDNAGTDATFVISGTNVRVEVTGVATTNYSWNLDKLETSRINA